MVKIKKKNPSYLHSLYSGVVFPPIHLPLDLWFEVLHPLIFNLLSLAAAMILSVINMLSLLARVPVLAFYGIMGRAKVMTKEEIEDYNNLM